MPIDIPSTSPLVSPHIVVLSCAASQNTYQKKILDTLCIEPKKQSHTGILHEIDTMRIGLADLTAYSELSRTESDKRIIDPNIIYAWIRSPDGKYYQIRIPRDLQPGINHALNIWGMAIRLKRWTMNGYNSEFELSSPDEKKWTILGTIFTSGNPIIQMMQNKEKRLTIIEDTIASRTTELKQIKQKFWKLIRKNERKKLIEVSAELESLHSDEKKLIAEIAWLKSQTPNLREYISFPYVPYQRALDNNKGHMAGMKHLWTIMTDAYKHLQSLERMTITESLNGKEVIRNVNTSDTPRKAPPELAILLNIIERMDYQVYYKTIPEHIEHQGVKTKFWQKWKTKIIPVKIPAQEVLRDTNELDTIMAEQVGRALTVFWLNKHDAYSWQRNLGSWALWIAQLIPDAYRNLQNKYSILQKEAGIPAEHEIGAKDQRVSMQFQIMHLYDEYHQLPSWIRSDWDTIMADRQAMIGLFGVLAAGYNGSMKNTLTEAGLGTPGTHTISELYPKNLREKFAHNRERYTYVLKLEYLFKKFFSEKK